ncbi:MAG: hypothetical protein IJE79_00685 [Alphaproteobacteria bacterium]|nr:hypothetical protein [Alphaproteobacteria bacterium]
MTGILMERLHKKLEERLLGSPDDKIVNNLSTYKTVAEKRQAFNAARENHAVAFDYNLNKIPLSSVKFNDVDFIGGEWRIQRPIPDGIQVVRGRPFLLGERLPKQEKNKFEFYRAALLTYNCYGYTDSITYTTIVAKYTTDNGTYWAYGSTIEQARAFLGIRLYDEYMDLIHSVACKNIMSK